MSGSQLTIALAGVGTVGQGVAKLVEQNAKQIAAVSGKTPVIAAALVRNPSSKDLSFLPDGCKTVESVDALLGVKPDVVLELMGGDGVAKDLFKASLAAGIPVVTANKALLAEHPEVFAWADEAKSCIGFEASCAGGIPIIAALRDGVAANNVNQLFGILNGTCNYILTQIAEHGTPYAEVLADAQEKGYAEADPTFDVGGYDAMHKLAVLSAIAFGVPIDTSAIALQGIDGIESQDINYGRELGYVTKLLAVAERQNGGLALRVQPMLVSKSFPISAVNGVLNAVSVEGDFIGRAMFTGPGAGGDATASAVMADVVEVACGQHLANYAKIRNLMQAHPEVSFIPVADLKSRYYLRLNVEDKPGVMRQITEVFEKHEISLASVMQKESHASTVPVVLLTHLTRESEITGAIEELRRLGSLTGDPVMLHLEG